MKEITMDELKRIQIGILDVVDEYCLSNGISYWLDSGTLLGAIRHNGYIPWDDDVDIGMLRPDFDRFIREFNSSNQRYKVICVENDPDCCYVYAKVLDTNTTLYEPDENGIKICVKIDVFVYDNAPNEKRKLKRAYDRRDFLRHCNILRNYNDEPSGGIFRRVMDTFLRVMIKPFPKNYFALKMVANSKKYNGCDTECVGNFTAFTRMICNKKVFERFIRHSFEGKEYNIPIGYDVWLKSFYGDYMQLPPIEKRVSLHKFKAYINDEG